MLCHQGLQSTVAGTVAAQQTKFSATAQHLGATAQVMHDTAGALQQQTLRLQNELADATTATTMRLRNTHGMAWKCSKVSRLALLPAKAVRIVHDVQLSSALSQADKLRRMGSCCAGGSAYPR